MFKNIIETRIKIESNVKDILKKLLEFTEQSSMKIYNADKFIMQVISIRYLKVGKIV